MRQEVTTRAVVIGRSSAGEGSVRAHLYTESLGLVTAVARSAREERSKLRAHLQGGTLGTFTLVKGKRPLAPADHWRVTGAVQTVHTHFILAGAASSLPDRQAGGEAAKVKQETVARILALIRQLVHGEGRDVGVFEALWEFLRALPTLTGADVVQAERLAALRVLAALGYVASAELPLVLPTIYTSESLASLASAEDHLLLAINKGIAASGLV